MAKLDKNSLLNGVRGSLGKELVLKKYDHGTVVTKYPDMSKVKWSKAQKKERSIFSEAVAYAQGIIHNPKKKAAYQKKLETGKSVYHAAIQEYLKKNRNTGNLSNPPSDSLIQT